MDSRGIAGNTGVEGSLAPGHADTDEATSAGGQVSRRVYGSLSSTSRSSSRLDTFDEEAQIVRSSRRTVSAPHMLPAHASGAEVARRPRLKTVDVLVAMGRLTQAVIFLSNRIDRAGLSTLCTRSINLTIEQGPQILPHDWRVETKLIRDRQVECGPEGLRDVIVARLATTGATVEARLAYTRGC